MEHPILLFFVLLLFLIVYCIKTIIQGIQTKNWLRLCLKIFLTAILIGFSYIWFVPIQAGWDRESPITKFRFQVFITDTDHYSLPSSIQNVLFEYRPSRYGWMHLGDKVGGWEEYFNLKPLNIFDETYQKNHYIWRKFLRAIRNKNNAYIKANSFKEIKCVDCIYPVKNKNEIYTVEELLSKNALDRYVYLYDRVLNVRKIDNTLFFSYSNTSFFGETYTDIFEFHWDPITQSYKFKSTFSVP
jgi:hypothetical protein